MTSYRSHEQQPPLLLEAPALPATMLFLSPTVRRRSPRSDIYLEMRGPDGLVYIVTFRSGLERLHRENVYVADCIFDRWGTWYLTWHGLTDHADDRPAPMRVDVVQADPLVNA